VTGSVGLRGAGGALDFGVLGEMAVGVFILA
jgi:hypothetical protein